MRTTSTNKLPPAGLKLRYGFTVSMVNAASVSSVGLVDQFSRLKVKRSSRFLGLLVGSVIIGSFIWLMEIIPLDGWITLLAGLSLAVIVVVFAPTWFSRKRVAKTREKSVTNLDERTENVQINSSKRLQKQTQVLMDLTQPQTLGQGDFQTRIGQITVAAADALEVGRISLWLYNQDRSHIDCVAVYEQHPDGHSLRHEGEENGLEEALDSKYSSLPPRPLTPSPHHPKSVAVAGRLDAPIWFNEAIIGVVCYERLTPTAPLWTPYDETFASSIASLVGMALQVSDYPFEFAKQLQPKARKRLEQKKPSQGDRILNSIPEAFFIVDQEWRFTYINSKTEQFLSRNSEQLLGQSFWEEFPHVMGSQFEQQYRRAVAEQVSVKFEEFYQPLQMWLEVRAYPYEGGLSVYWSDITQEKQANKQRFAQMRDANTSLTHISTLAAAVGVALAQGGTLLSILQGCTDAIRQQLNASSATIWTLNQVTQQLELQATSGQGIILQPELLDLVAKTRQPDWNSQESEEPIQGEPSFSPLPLIYPLVVEERVMGVLAVVGDQSLTTDAGEIWNGISSAIAIAIDRYWVRSELLTQRESLLLELANQIRHSLELDTILETAVESIRSLFQIDRCHFLWFRYDPTEPYWEVVNEAKNPNLPSHIGRYTTTQVRLSVDRLLHRQMIQVDQVESFKHPRLRKFLLNMGYTSVLSIPIRTQGGAIGMISCGQCTDTRPWQESEVELLQAVVAQLAIALDQAELYAQARQAADEAQAKAQELERALYQLHTTQSQLVQSEKMSSLGQLVAGVAHEINNPINFIHGNLAYAGAYTYDVLNLLRLYQEQYPHPEPAIAEQAELINIDFIATDLPKLIGSMQRGTDRIRSIVQSLRKFSRADEADMKKVDVHEGLESTLLILQHRLKAKGKQPEITIYKDYGNLPLVECYPGELNQVFMNILINAIEALKPSEVAIQEQASLFVPHISPSITIRTRLLEHCESRNPSESAITLMAEPPDSTIAKTEILNSKSYQRIVIQIADNGPGMTESIKARLFDPFFTTKPVGQGCGLGLSISYQIVVEHHRGILTCTSVPGQGSEFWVEIPIIQAL